MRLRISQHRTSYLLSLSFLSTPTMSHRLSSESMSYHQWKRALNARRDDIKSTNSHHPATNRLLQICREQEDVIKRQFESTTHLRKEARQQKEEIINLRFKHFYSVLLVNHYRKECAANTATITQLQREQKKQREIDNLHSMNSEISELIQREMVRFESSSSTPSRIPLETSMLHQNKQIIDRLTKENDALKQQIARDQIEKSLENELNDIDQQLQNRHLKIELEIAEQRICHLLNGTDQTQHFNARQLNEAVTQTESTQTADRLIGTDSSSSNQPTLRQKCSVRRSKSLNFEPENVNSNELQIVKYDQSEAMRQQQRSQSVEPSIDMNQNDVLLSFLDHSTKCNLSQIVNVLKRKTKSVQQQSYRESMRVQDIPSLITIKYRKLEKKHIALQDDYSALNRIHSELNRKHSDISEQHKVCESNVKLLEHKLAECATLSKNKKLRNELISQLLRDGIFVMRYLFDGTSVPCTLSIDFERGICKYRAVGGDQSYFEETDTVNLNSGQILLKYLKKIQKGAKTTIFLKSDIGHRSKLNKQAADRCFSLIFPDELTLDFEACSKTVCKGIFHAIISHMKQEHRTRATVLSRISVSIQH